MLQQKQQQLKFSASISFNGIIYNKLNT